MTLDHLRYIEEQPYRREVHAQLRRLIASQPRAVGAMNVVHEAGNSCCLREAWPVTHARILAALAADGERVLGVVL